MFSFVVSFVDMTNLKRVEKIQVVYIFQYFFCTPSVTYTGINCDRICKAFTEVVQQ